MAFGGAVANSATTTTWANVQLTRVTSNSTIIVWAIDSSNQATGFTSTSNISGNLTAIGPLISGNSTPFSGSLGQMLIANNVPGGNHFISTNCIGTTIYGVMVAWWSNTAGIDNWGRAWSANAYSANAAWGQNGYNPGNIAVTTPKSTLIMFGFQDTGNRPSGTPNIGTSPITFVSESSGLGSPNHTLLEDFVLTTTGVYKPTMGTSGQGTGMFWGVALAPLIVTTSNFFDILELM
jgi:hypothetical protein